MASRSVWEATESWPRPGEFVPNTVSIEVDIDRIQKLCHTNNFYFDDLLVVRRGTSIPVTLRTRSQLLIESASLVYDENSSVSLGVDSQNSRVYGTTLKVENILILCT